MNDILNSVSLNERFLEYLVFFVTFPAEAVVVHHFFDSLLGKKLKNNLFINLYYFVYCIANYILYVLPVNEYCKMLFHFAMILIASMLYKRNFLWKICASLFLLALIYFSDIIAISSMMLVIAGDEMVLTIIKLVFGKIVMMVLEVIAVKLLTSFGKGTLSSGWFITVIISPILSVFVLCALSQMDDIVQSEYMPVVFLPLGVGLIFINYFIYMLCDNMIYKQYTEKQTLLLKQQVEYYQNQYQLAEQSQIETLKFRHDIKNILLGLKTELDAGKVIEGKDILESLITDFSSIKKVAHSGNIIIDSIINFKKKQTDHLGIPLLMDFQFPNNIILDTTTISVILGNAIDNAIEACTNIKSKDKYIKIQFNYQNESLFINIENPFLGSVRTDISGRILTKKKNTKMHGIGLQSIRDIVEKENGILDIAYDNHIFKIQIILFDIII